MRCIPPYNFGVVCPQGSRHEKGIFWYPWRLHYRLHYSPALETTSEHTALDAASLMLLLHLLTSISWTAAYVGKTMHGSPSSDCGGIIWWWDSKPRRRDPETDGRWWIDDMKALRNCISSFVVTCCWCRYHLLLWHLHPQKCIRWRRRGFRWRIHATNLE